MRNFKSVWSSSQSHPLWVTRYLKINIALVHRFVFSTLDLIKGNADRLFEESMPDSQR